MEECFGLTRVEAELNGVLLGKKDVVRAAIACFAAGGHLLLEDGPGVGKTLLGRSLAARFGATDSRIQGTPDLLPSDITGVEIFDPVSRCWEFHEGPVFADVVLVDELNRLSPRTQSALLQAMGERTVTTNGATRQLGRFLVLATQNPAETIGTFPLGEAQRDRFMASTSIGRPSTETLITLMTAGDAPGVALGGLDLSLTMDDLEKITRDVAATWVEPAVADYLIRVWNQVLHASSTTSDSARPLQHAIAFARAIARLEGRDFVSTDDAKAAARYCFPHRIVKATQSMSSGLATIEEALASTSVEDHGQGPLRSR